jgi:hypothetical protein
LLKPFETDRRGAAGVRVEERLDVGVFAEHAANVIRIPSFSVDVGNAFTLGGSASGKDAAVRPTVALERFGYALARILGLVGPVVADLLLVAVVRLAMSALMGSRRRVRDVFVIDAVHDFGVVVFDRPFFADLGEFRVVLADTVLRGRLRRHAFTFWFVHLVLTGGIACRLERRSPFADDWTAVLHFALQLGTTFLFTSRGRGPNRDGISADETLGLHPYSAVAICTIFAACILPFNQTKQIIGKLI